MTPVQREQLDNEVIRGGKCQIAYDNFIKDFVDSKKELLFDQFKTITMTNPDNIIEIKRMAQVIDQLDAEIISIISTGKAAAMTIANDNATNNPGNNA